MRNLLKKEQVLKKLRERLRSGEIPPGSKLKSGIELAQEFDVSHITIRSVLRELSLTGELLVIHGKGTFAPESEKKHLAPKLLVVSGGGNLEYSGNYIIPSFIARTSELGGQVTEINVRFIRNNPSDAMAAVLRSSGYTGVLLYGHGYVGNEPELRIFQQLGLPVILVHALQKDLEITGFPAFGNNARQAWEDGLKAVLNTGRKRIALLLCGSCSTIYRGRSLDEHRQLICACGADPDPDLIQVCANVSAPGSDQNIAEAVEKLLALPEKPEAIYCFSDFLALKVYDILHRKKLRIPEDIAVMGYCGYPGGTLLDPPLATVDQDYAAFGKLAAEKLCAPEKWFTGVHVPEWWEVPYKVCVRASIGKPAMSKNNVLRGVFFNDKTVCTRKLS